MNTGRPIDILLVDDNPGDQVLTREALLEGQVANRLHIANDGVEAIDFLRRRGRFHDAPRPHLIVLDLNMPRKGGHEVLEEIKQDPELRSIPVVVMTSSREQGDILGAYSLHANCFVTKPADLEDFQRAVQEIERFWHQVAELPDTDG